MYIVGCLLYTSDNFAFFEADDGNFTMVLSDGMGSGENACRDSEAVADMTEAMLEAGLPLEMACLLYTSTRISQAAPKACSPLRKPDSQKARSASSYKGTFPVSYTHLVQREFVRSILKSGLRWMHFFGRKSFCAHTC